LPSDRPLVCTSSIPATGKKVSVDAITIHRMANGKIAESWEV